MDSANAASEAPKKSSSLVPRILSALVLIPLMLVLVWLHYWTVVVATLAATVVMLMELFKLFEHGGYKPRVWLGIGIGLAIGLAVALDQLARSPFALTPFILTAAIVVSLIGELRRQAHEHVLTSWALTLAGALYIGWMLSHFIQLRVLDTPLRESPLGFLSMSSGAAWVYTIFAITWIQDSAAYFVGKSFGRRQLAPILSPKKTWEGAFGGLVSSVVAGILCVLLFGLPISIAAGALLGLVGGIVGPLGDLAESMMKRQIGLKDAGHLIPGHGGLLDRADSILFTAPALFYLILLLV